MVRNKTVGWLDKSLSILIVTVFLMGIGLQEQEAFAGEKLPRVKLSVTPLDLTKPISREEIMAAGQLGGQLFPTHEVPDISRESEINHSFGEAIQEWNKHEFKNAIKLFKKHMEQYLDSPWVAEAVLHIGCDAHYTGRYSEAEESFNWILKNLEGKTHDGAKELVTKATIRLGVLKVALNNFHEAGKHFTEVLKMSNNWRDRTYASHWIQRLSRYKSDKLAILNCGSLALAQILDANGKRTEAQEVRQIRPASLLGHNVLDLKDIAARYGYDIVGLRITDRELPSLPLPAIVQIDGRKTGDSGHYWVLEKANTDELELFDPQAERKFSQNMGQFASQWSGIAMVLKSADTTLEIGQKLSQSEQETLYGGCCGLPRPPDDLGPPPDDSCGGCCGGASGRCGCGGRGAPGWSVNLSNMNLYVFDTPLWYTPPIGPPVEISLSYNSQSSVVYLEPFGNKWTLNYESYLVVDTAGTVTIVMPGGRLDSYSPDGSGGYIGQKGVFNTLTKIAHNHYILRLPDDTVYEYDFPTALNFQQVMLTKITDRYGQSLTFGYGPGAVLTTITDAIGQVTTISYTGAHATSITDPFGRSATLEYTQGNLTKITDMGGYWTSLSYDPTSYLASMTTPKGTTTFNIEPADNSGANSDNYPPPGNLMWDNYRITITDPSGGKEEFFYYGGCYLGLQRCGGLSWHVTPKYYVPWESYYVNNFRSNPYKKIYMIDPLNGRSITSTVVNPDGGRYQFTTDPSTMKTTSITDPNTHTRTYSYNSRGRIITATDAKQKTTVVTYAPNNLDPTSISNGLGTISLAFNGFHNATSVTNRLGKSTRYTYNDYGKVSSITDALNHTTNYNYYGANESGKYRLKEIIREGKRLFGFVYDAVGRVFSKTDPAGITLVYTYDNLDRVKTITYPDGKEEQFNYSACCPWLLDSYTDRGGRTTKYSYDSLRRLTDTELPDKTHIKFEYDSDGNMTKLIDPANNVTKFEYDPMKRLVKKTYPNGKFESYTYDKAGLLISRANARDAAASRTTASYVYDENDNLTGIAYTDGTPTVSYIYDDYDRVIANGDGIGAWGYTYDAESRVREVDGPWENDTVTLSYDDVGKITGVQVQGGEGTIYDYDIFDRLWHVKPGERTFTYSYPDDSPSPLISKLTRPNGSSTTYDHDSLARLQQISNKNSADQIINSDAFTYNGRDMRDSETITNGPAISNLTANKTTYSYNNLNQLLSSISPNQVFEYDDDGNMTKGYTPDGLPFTAAYDAENRLKTISYVDGASNSHRTDYFYRANSFLAKQVADGVATRYLRDRYTLLQERDDANNIQRAYAWDPTALGGIGGLLEMSQGGQQFSYLFDGKGNVTAVIDGAQSVAAAYRYDEFGNLTSQTDSLNQSFKFSTKNYDSKYGQYYYGYRFYSPVLGRWMQRDPLKEIAGINLYSFINNNSIGLIDPNGKLGVGAAVGIGIGVVQGASGAIAQNGTPADVVAGAILGGIEGGVVGLLDPSEGVGTVALLSGMVGAASNITGQVIANAKKPCYQQKIKKGAWIGAGIGSAIGGVMGHTFINAFTSLGASEGISALGGAIGMAPGAFGGSIGEALE